MIRSRSSSHCCHICLGVVRNEVIASHTAIIHISLLKYLATSSRSRASWTLGFPGYGLVVWRRISSFCEDVKQVSQKRTASSPVLVVPSIAKVTSSILVVPRSFFGCSLLGLCETSLGFDHDVV